MVLKTDNQRKAFFAKLKAGVIGVTKRGAAREKIAQFQEERRKRRLQEELDQQANLAKRTRELEAEEKLQASIAKQFRKQRVLKEKIAKERAEIKKEMSERSRTVQFLKRLKAGAGKVVGSLEKMK